MSLSSGLVAADTTANAKAILAQAEKKAAAEHKNVFVKFSASWCGPCRLWDTVLNDPKVRPIMDQQFVTIDLDTAENKGDMRHQETPGAQELMASLGNKGISLPFLAVLHPSGKLIFNSIRPTPGKPDGEDIGYPTEPDELDFFIQKLHMASPSITEQQLQTIRQVLMDNHKPHHA